MEENDFYAGVYRKVQDQGLSGWYISQSHKALERLPEVRNVETILEVGGNIGEHINFVSRTFSKYTLTDYRDTGFLSSDSKIEFKAANVEKLPFENTTFDRVISTCLLHHVNDPILALNEMRRVTKSGGLISILIPCDPGFLYRLAKKFGTNKKWGDGGITNPTFYHYKQHRNHFPALNIFVKEIFKDDEINIKFWPSPIKSWNFNFFVTYQISKK